MDETNNKCNNCVDLVHEFMGKHITKYNHMGDVFVFLNVAILLYVIGTNAVTMTLIAKVFLIGLVLYFIRGLAATVTICDADTNRKYRPITSKDNYWYLVSGHTLNAMLVTYLVLNSTVNDFVKYISVTLTLLVIFFQTATREHYSVDILLTVVIVHLALKAYI